jgi:hypothetical protein
MLRDALTVVDVRLCCFLPRAIVGCRSVCAVKQTAVALQAVANDVDQLNQPHTNNSVCRHTGADSTQWLSHDCLFVAWRPVQGTVGRVETMGLLNQKHCCQVC